MAEVFTSVASLDDDRFFELLSKVVFYTGFHRGVVERKWEHFQTAFCGFAIVKVAEFDETDVERLLAKDSPIVKNARKVMATVHNAKVCRQLVIDHGSMAQFLQAVLAQQNRNLEGAFKRAFELVGESAAHSLLLDLRGAAILI